MPNDKTKPNFFDFRRKVFDMSFENFIVDESNEKAYQMCKHIADHFFEKEGGVFLIGPEKSGKTHLIEAMLKTLLKKDPGLRIRCLPMENFIGRIIECRTLCSAGEKKHSTDCYLKRCAESDVLVIEDVQLLKNKEFFSEAFADLLAMARNGNCKIILSSHTERLNYLNIRALDIVDTFTKIALREQNEALMEKYLEKAIELSSVSSDTFPRDKILKECQNIQELKKRLIEAAKTNPILKEAFSFEKPKREPDFILKMYAGKGDGYRGEIDWEMLQKDENTRKRVAYKLYSRSGLSRKEISEILDCAQDEVDEGIQRWESAVATRPSLGDFEDKMEELFEKRGH